MEEITVKLESLVSSSREKEGHLLKPTESKMSNTLEVPGSYPTVEAFNAEVDRMYGVPEEGKSLLKEGYKKAVTKYTASRKSTQAAQKDVHGIWALFKVAERGQAVASTSSCMQQGSGSGLFQQPPL